MNTKTTPELFAIVRAGLQHDASFAAMGAALDATDELESRLGEREAQTKALRAEVVAAKREAWDEGWNGGYMSRAGLGSAVNPHITPDTSGGEGGTDEPQNPYA